MSGRAKCFQCGRDHALTPKWEGSTLDAFSCRACGAKFRPQGYVCPHPCPECGGQMRLKSSQYGLFYGCEHWPECNATHGAHPNGEPLGIPADKETKAARIRAHEVFDRLWKEGHMERGEAYAWMQRALGLSKDEAHFARFGTEECEQVIQAAQAELRRLGVGYADMTNSDDDLTIAPQSTLDVSKLVSISPDGVIQIYPGAIYKATGALPAEQRNALYELFVAGQKMANAMSWFQAGPGQNSTEEAATPEAAERAQTAWKAAIAKANEAFGIKLENEEIGSPGITH